MDPFKTRVNLLQGWDYQKPFILLVALAASCIAIRLEKAPGSKLRGGVAEIKGFYDALFVSVTELCRPPASRKDEEKQIDQLLHVQSSENDTIQDLLGGFWAVLMV